MIECELQIAVSQMKETYIARDARMMAYIPQPGQKYDIDLANCGCVEI